MFEFKINLEDSDYFMFNQYHFFNNTEGKKALMLFRAVIPFVCLMFLLALIVQKSNWLVILIQAIVMTIVSILWIRHSKKMIIKSIGKRIEEVKKEGRLPYSKEAILKFYDESIHEITPDSENRTKYSVVEKIALTERAIYIYFSSVQAYILPLTAFSEEMEKSRFLEFINSKTGILLTTIG